MYRNRIIEPEVIKKLKNKKVLVILGPRQAGKTTLIKYLLKHKEARFLNLDVRKDLAQFQAFAMLSAKEAESYLGNPEFLVIDEAQRESETGRIVKGFWDSGIGLKFILLGSSALDIKGQAAESLAGRNEKVYLTPFSFKEILQSRDWYNPSLKPEVLHQAFAVQLRHQLLENLVFGCYPEAALSQDKAEFLANLLEDYVFKDVLDLGLVKSKEPIFKLLSLLAGQVGGEVSVNELAAQLGQARATVEKYIDLLEETFILFRVPAFSRNSRKEVSKNKKIYFWDTGIRNAVLGEFSLNEWRSDIGQLWENWVVAEAAKQNLQSGARAKLYFWRTRIGSEVDLVIKTGDKLRAYEIKWQARKIKARAFESRYHIPVKLVHAGEPVVDFFKFGETDPL